VGAKDEEDALSIYRTFIRGIMWNAYTIFYNIINNIEL
jgi:hypothetical protein